MNRLATLATMPFLITYGVIEYSYFALCMQFDLNQERLQNYRAHGVPSPTFGASKKAVENGGPIDGVAKEKVGKKLDYFLFHFCNHSNSKRIPSIFF